MKGEMQAGNDHYCAEYDLITNLPCVNFVFWILTRIGISLSNKGWRLKNEKGAPVI